MAYKKKVTEFTNTEMKLIYSLVDEYGGEENKKELMREIKSIIRYDRMLFKTRIAGALNKIF